MTWRCSPTSPVELVRQERRTQDRFHMSHWHLVVISFTAKRRANLLNYQRHHRSDPPSPSIDTVVWVNDACCKFTHCTVCPADGSRLEFVQMFNERPAAAGPRADGTHAAPQPRTLQDISIGLFDFSEILLHDCFFEPNSARVFVFLL